MVCPRTQISNKRSSQRKVTATPRPGISERLALATLMPSAWRFLEEKAPRLLCKVPRKRINFTDRVDGSGTISLGLEVSIATYKQKVVLMSASERGRGSIHR